ncbi:MAG: hypothetical protein ACE14V_16055 [bacterium]
MKRTQLMLIILSIIGMMTITVSGYPYSNGTAYTSPSQMLDNGGKTRAGGSKVAIDAIGQPGIGTAAGGTYKIEHGFLYTMKWLVNTYGQFTASSDTTHWYYEKYGDGTAAGTLSRLASYGGMTGVLRIRQTPGQKAQLSQVFSVSSPGWYIARAKVATDVATVSKQQKVYLYLQELASDSSVAKTANQVIASGAGGMAAAGTWKQMEIAQYTSTTILGVQVVGINPTSSGVTANIYFDDIEVERMAPNGYGGSTSVSIVNPTFTSDTDSWLVQVYADGTGPGTWSWATGWYGRTGLLKATQNGGQKGKASQVCSAPAANKNAVASVWVYSAATSNSNTQKVYLYFYSYDGAYTKVMESGNGILQAGKWTKGEWQKIWFGYTPMTKYNAVQVVAIDPAGRPTQSIYFDSISISQE